MFCRRDGYVEKHSNTQFKK